MSTITNKLTVSPSPHIKDKVTTSSLMLNVIIALVPAAVASVVIFGISSLILIATCVITCVVGEYLFNVVCKKPQTIGDLSAVVTGILLAFNLDGCGWFPVCHRDGQEPVRRYRSELCQPRHCRPCNPADLLLRSHDQLDDS